MISMCRFQRLFRWCSIIPTVVIMSGAFLLAGCGEAVKTDAPAEVHPDVMKNQNAMEDFQKKNPKFGKAGGPGGAK